MPDKFPEAFERFTDVILVNKIKTWNQLQLVFGSWAGSKWVPTSKQLNALATQARKLGIETTEYPKRKQINKPIIQTRPLEQQIEAVREKQFSKEYNTFKVWKENTARTTAYQRRIINYMKTHPNAKLAEARGHKTKRF